jgi:hypothetical protein
MNSSFYGLLNGYYNSDGILIERVEDVVKGRICFERVGDIEVVNRSVKGCVTILSG